MICLTTFILANLILKIIYFKNTYRDKSNNISFVNICMYILIEKYGQNRAYEYYIKSKLDHLVWNGWNILKNLLVQRLYIFY
jgi:hypothetical protein